MKRTPHQFFSYLVALMVIPGGLSSAAENENRILATSSSGGWRAELKGEEFWIVSIQECWAGGKIAGGVSREDAGGISFFAG